MAICSLQKLHIHGETNSEAETSVKEFIVYCEHLERQEKSSQVNQNFFPKSDHSYKAYFWHS